MSTRDALRQSKECLAPKLCPLVVPSRQCFFIGSVSVEMAAARHHLPVASSLPVVLYGNETSRIDLPTVGETNSLSEKFQQHNHGLVTRYDKSGDVQTIALLREDRDASQRRVEELKPVLLNRKENISKPRSNGLNRNQVSRTTLRGSLSSPEVDELGVS